MFLVGLIGEAGSGKSTVAHHLAARYGFVELSVAQPLKDLCVEQFGWDARRMDELAYKEEQDPLLPAGWTRRKVLQHIGTDCFRSIDPNHWVKQNAAAIRTEIKANHSVAIADVRFPNEIEMIRQLGGVIVLVRRAGDFEGTTSSRHSSENAWRETVPDFGVHAPNGVEHVYAATDDLVELLRTPACWPNASDGTPRA